MQQHGGLKPYQYTCGPTRYALPTTCCVPLQRGLTENLLWSYFLILAFARKWTCLSPLDVRFTPWTTIYRRGRKSTSGTSVPALVSILGLSPKHARSVALVLNLQTGMVSPQFHTKCDDLFETVSGFDGDQNVRWQYVTKFRKSMERSSAPEGVIPSTSTRLCQSNPGNGYTGSNRTDASWAATRITRRRRHTTTYRRYHSWGSVSTGQVVR